MRDSLDSQNISKNSSQVTNIKEAIIKRLNIPRDSKIIFEDGNDVDLTTLEKNLHIPALRTFKYIKYFKNESKRWT